MGDAMNTSDLIWVSIIIGLVVVSAAIVADMYSDWRE